MDAKQRKAIINPKNNDYDNFFQNTITVAVTWTNQNKLTENK